MKDYKEKQRKTVTMLLILVISTIMLVFGIAQMDIVVTSVLSRTGMPENIEFVSSILKLEPHQVYHAGIGMILGGYMLVVILFLESKFRDST